MINKAILKLLLGSFLILPNIIKAQKAKNIVSQNNGWFMYFGNHKLTDKFSLHSEYQWRRSNIITDWQQSLLRFGLDWHYSKQLSLTGGYGWIQSFPYGSQPISYSFNEHRIWQQLMLKHKNNRLYFNHRYRLEQRFLENVSANNTGKRETDGYRYRNRARYRLLVTIPITNNTLKDNTLFLSSYAEIFLGFGAGIGSNILDQSRLYTALGWRFNKQLNLQLGYLNHYVIKGDGVSAERNHTLQLAVTYNMDFSKKEE